MEVELMIPGNFLDLILMKSPTGEWQRTNFILHLILSKKKLVIDSRLSGTPNPLASPLLTLETMPSKSSLGNKSKIHPEFNLSLIGIKNYSSFIWVSVIKNTLGEDEVLEIFL